MVGDAVPPEELLARMSRRDVAALSELYDLYAPRIYGLIVHILSSREAAEEMLQEVFMRLWNESSRLSREGRSVAAWLVFTARAAAVDRRRVLRKPGPITRPQGTGTIAEKAPGAGTRKCKTLVPEASAPKSLSAQTAEMSASMVDAARTPTMVRVSPHWLPQPREIALIDDRLALLHKAINQLPKPQREALELAIFGGLNESEIAAEMGETLGKVRTSLRAAITFVKHRRRAICGTWAANI